MPIYRRDESGQFAPFEKTPFPELEKHLEDWIESNPEMLLEGEPLAIMGRQAGTTFGKFSDLLAVDESGACVVIELKRGVAPREVIAQTLEYTAWVDSRSLEDLNEIARTYAVGHGIDAETLWDLYRHTFLDSEVSSDDLESASDEIRITFNARQRMVIVAEDFPGEMEQTLRYLRTRVGVDISAIRFAVHQLGAETLVDTEVVVGRERPISAVGKSSVSAGPWSHNEIVEYVEPDFLKVAVEGLEEWLGSLGMAGLEVRHLKRSDHALYVAGTRIGGYYFAKRWLHFWLRQPTEGDRETLAQLSEPPGLHRNGKVISGNVHSEADLNILKHRIRSHVGAVTT